MTLITNLTMSPEHYQARLFTPAGELDETFFGPAAACLSMCQAWALELCADAIARDVDPVLARDLRALAASIGEIQATPETGYRVRCGAGGWTMEVTSAEREDGG